MTSSSAQSRRTFLARVGILGAAAGCGGLLSSQATAAADPLAGLITRLRPVLDELSRDTLNGLTTFVMPGNDAYSAAQGTHRPEAGALDAGDTGFMVSALDDFVPFPDELARPIAAAFTTAASDIGIPLPPDLPPRIGALDEALGVLLRNDAPIPLSLAIAMLLNLLATQVNPAAVRGPFLSPFSRLSYSEKARAFSLVEGADSDLVGLLDTKFPEPSHDAVSGLLKFVGGALLEFPAFGGYSEYAVFDTHTRTLRARPVGWQLSGYQPHGPVEGWDEFKGYYQGRKEVHD